MQPPPPPSLDEDHNHHHHHLDEDLTIPELPIYSTIAPRDEEVAPNKSIGSAPISRKKKFSFKHGKMSVTEAPRVNPGTIYLEVQGREIEVWENILPG